MRYPGNNQYLLTSPEFFTSAAQYFRSWQKEIGFTRMCGLDSICTCMELNHPFLNPKRDLHAVDGYPKVWWGVNKIP